MAELKAKYQIEFDEADLASKLEMIKTRVDDALSSNIGGISPTFQNAAPGILPQAGPQIAPAPIPLAAAGSEFLGNFASGLNTAVFGNGVGSGGYGQYTEAQVQSGPQTMFQSIIGGMGVMAGYDPNLPLGRTSYQDLSARRMAEGLNGALSSELGLSLMGGAAVGGISALLGGAFLAPASVAMTIGALGYGTMRTLGRRQLQQYEFGSLLKDSLDQVNTTEDGMEITRALQERVLSWEGRAQGLDFNQVQDNIAIFASEGGFSSSDSVQQVKDKALAVTEQVRNLSQSLGIVQEEAAALMGRMEKNLISTAEKTTELIGKLQSTSVATGLSAQELLNIGMASVDASRGTMLSGSSAFDMGLQSAALAGGIASSGEFGRGLAAQMGGVQGMAQRNFANTLQAFSGGMGQLMMGAMETSGATGVMGMSMLDRLSGASDYYTSDPSKILTAGLRQGELLSKYSYTDLSGIRMTGTMDIAEQMGLDSTDGYVLARIIQSQTGVSAPEALAQVAEWQQLPNMLAVEQGARLEEVMSLADSRSAGGFGSAIRAGVGAVGDMFTSQSAGVAAIAAAKGISDFTEDVADWWNRVERVDGRKLNLSEQKVASNLLAKTRGKTVDEAIAILSKEENRAADAITGISKSLKSKDGNALVDAETTRIIRGIAGDVGSIEEFDGTLKGRLSEIDFELEKLGEAGEGGFWNRSLKDLLSDDDRMRLKNEKEAITKVQNLSTEARTSLVTNNELGSVAGILTDNIGALDKAGRKILGLGTGELGEADAARVEAFRELEAMRMARTGEDSVVSTSYNFDYKTQQQTIKILDEAIAARDDKEREAILNRGVDIRMGVTNINSSEEAVMEIAKQVRKIGGAMVGGEMGGALTVVLKGSNWYTRLTTEKE